MPYIGGSKEAVQLLTELEDSGNLIRLNSRDWLSKVNDASAPAVMPIVNNADLLLAHLNPSDKPFSDRLLRIYPPVSPVIQNKQCLFLVLNLALQRVLCIGTEDGDVFAFDPSEGEFHTALQDVAGIDMFLQSDRLNQVQKLVDGLSEYVQSLSEYKSLFRFSEDEVFAVLENTDGESDSSLVEIEGMSLTRGELIEYDKIISANALRMNVATRKVDFFFPDFDFSQLNPDEFL